MSLISSAQKDTVLSFQRIFSIDILKAFGIICVILHHTLTSYPSSSVLWKFVAYFICFMAIPVMMIVTGFNYTSSFERHNHLKICSWFSVKSFAAKLKRIYIPFLICFGLEIFLFRFYSSFPMIFKAFLSGGSGAGGYYIPQLLQILIYFPFLYHFICRFPKAALMLCFSVGVFFDFLTSNGAMSLSCYRLFGSRYLIYIGAGIYLYEKQKAGESISRSKLFLLAGASWIYILFQAFGSPENSLLHIFYLQGNDWRFLGVMVFGWAFLIVITVLRSSCKALFGLKNIIVHISQATFHIYLVQKLFFAKFVPYLPCAFACYINVLLCVSFGLLWRYIENRVACYFKYR